MSSSALPDPALDPIVDTVEGKTRPKPVEMRFGLFGSAQAVENKDSFPPGCMQRSLTRRPARVTPGERLEFACSVRSEVQPLV